jgi:hypothetical protein
MIFVVGGPFIGLVLISAVAAVVQRKVDQNPAMWMGAFFAAYLFGLIPMLVAALVDRFSEGSIYRIALCALAGCAACLLLAHWIVPSNTPWQYLPLVGFAGAISAAACSWLSEKMK